MRNSDEFALKEAKDFYLEREMIKESTEPGPGGSTQIEGGTSGSKGTNLQREEFGKEGWTSLDFPGNSARILSKTAHWKSSSVTESRKENLLAMSLKFKDSLAPGLLDPFLAISESAPFSGRCPSLGGKLVARSSVLPQILRNPGNVLELGSDRLDHIQVLPGRGGGRALDARTSWTEW